MQVERATFRNPSYLTRGNARQQHAYRALESLKLFRILRAYTPILTGTIPLNIDIRGSDLDVICAAHDLDAFTRAVTDAFGVRSGFRIKREAIKGVESVIVNFDYGGFPIEIFGQANPAARRDTKSRDLPRTRAAISTPRARVFHFH